MRGSMSSWTIVVAALMSCGVVAPAHGSAPTMLERMAMGAAPQGAAPVEVEAVADGSGGRIAVVRIDGVDEVLDLRPHSVRSPAFEVLVPDGSGGLARAAVSAARTYRGTVAARPGSWVAASVSPAGMVEAWIDTGDGRRWWLEPVRTGPGVAAGHVLYTPEAASRAGVSCGVTAWGPAPVVTATAVRGSTACGSELCVAELACDADWNFHFDQDSPPSVASTVARIESIINAVNVQFESSVQIRHEVTTIIVRTSPAEDPYSQTDANALLAEFRDEWNTNHAGVQRDLAQLFTGRNLDGQTIGLAATGTVCQTALAYSIVESGWSGDFACATDLTAHELGHVWGANHCSCEDPDYTMNPEILCANVFNPAISVPAIIAKRNNSNCLTPDPPPPGSFQLLSPSSGASGVPLAPLMDWEDSVNATSYEIEIDDTPGFPSPVLSITVNQSQVQLGDGLLQVETQYFWRVTANGFSGQMRNSTPQFLTFTTEMAGCTGDVNGDGRSNGSDLSIMIGFFGMSVAPGTFGDVNGDGVVNAADLSVLITDFGCDSN